jgi:hypothetical protein
LATLKYNGGDYEDAVIWDMTPSSLSTSARL